MKIHCLFYGLLLSLLACQNRDNAHSSTASFEAPAQVKKQVRETTKSPRSGDLIFQTSLSNQSQAIQLATGSPYSHMGIIYEEQGRFFVYEAIQTVQLTPLSQWIQRGKGQHYVIKRLKEADKYFTPSTIHKLKEAGRQYAGKSYDIYFGWSDEQLYCSELVWKMYKQTLDIEIGTLQRLGDFDLTAPLVKQKLTERYGQLIPLEEKVISPQAMFASDLLKVVMEE